MSEAFGRRVVNRSEHSGVGDRNSTRVHAPPGGRTTISLFHADVADETPRDAPSLPLRHAPANTAATVETTHGRRTVNRDESMGIGDRPSTTVHAPPGGRTTISLFYGDVGAEAPRTAASQPPCDAPAEMVAPEMTTHGQRIVNRDESMGISDRNSTRVHAAPGGNGSQMASIMGGGGDAIDSVSRRKALLLERRQLLDRTNSAIE